MDIGSIFQDFEDIFSDIFGGGWPEPPDHVPLKILGLSGDPGRDEIKRAYHRAIMAAHPDLKLAFDNPAYRDMAQSSYGTFPDVQELIWASRCALRKRPEVKDVTDNNVTTMGGLRPVTREPRKYFEVEKGQPRICRTCGAALPPPVRTSISHWPMLFCDKCHEKEEKGEFYFISRHRRCPRCRVWMGDTRFKYCSHECSRAAERERRQMKRPSSKRSCSDCKKEFVPTRMDARYCSARCRQRAHRGRVG